MKADAETIKRHHRQRRLAIKRQIKLLSALRAPVVRLVCVGPRVGWNCCQSAFDLDGIEFPIDAVPEVPLQGCDRWCGCAFTFHPVRD